MKYVAFNFLVIFVAIGSFYSFAKDAIPLSWTTMKQLNYETGEMSESLLNVSDQLVEVKGFIVPLEMDEYLNTVKEFFLVPDPMACIHVPPPPPNQIIYIRMKKRIPLDMDYRGVAIQGTLRFSHSSNGIHGYEMDGISAKEADVEYDDPLKDILDY